MQDGKLWVRVHVGKSGLKPLLGNYKSVKYGTRCDRKTLPDDGLAIGTKKILSARLPPLDGPSDIEFLRNKFGWCMPTAEQVVSTQKLTAGLINYTVTLRPSVVPSVARSSKTMRSSETRRLQLFWQKHHFSSKTSDQLEREKLMSKITEELREYERHQAIETTLYPRKSLDHLSTTQPKQTYSNSRHRASSFVRHKEIRTTEVFKISRRATTSFKTHLVIMEKKLSLQSKDDTELTKTVRSKLDKSKSLDRMEKLSKISRLETQRKKFTQALSEMNVAPKLEPASETLEEDFLEL